MSITVIPGQNFDGFVQGFAATTGLMQGIRKSQLEEQRMTLEAQYLQHKMSMDQQLTSLQLQAKQAEIGRIKLESQDLENMILEKKATFGDRKAEQEWKARQAEMAVENQGVINQTNQFNLSQAQSLAPFKMDEAKQGLELVKGKVLEAQQRRELIEKEMKNMDFTRQVQEFDFSQKKFFGVLKDLEKYDEESLRVIAQSTELDPVWAQAAQARLDNPADPMKKLIGPQWDRMPAELQATVTTQYLMTALQGNARPEMLAALDMQYGDDPEKLREMLEMSGVNPSARSLMQEFYRQDYASRKPKKSSGGGMGGLSVLPDGMPSTMKTPTSSGRAGFTPEQVETSINMYLADQDPSVRASDVLGVEPLRSQAGTAASKSYDVRQAEISRFDASWKIATSNPKTKQEVNRKRDELIRLRQVSSEEELKDILAFETGPHHIPAKLLRDLLLKTKQKHVVIQKAHDTGLLYQLNEGQRRKLEQMAKTHGWKP
jgi:hypothetical protein